MNYVLDLILNAFAGAVAAAVLGVLLVRIPGVQAWLLAQSPARIALITFLATALVVSGVFIAYINRVSGMKYETELEFLNKVIEPASVSVNETRMAGDFGNDSNKNWYECGKHARIAVGWAMTTQTKLMERRDLLVRSIKP